MRLPAAIWSRLDPLGGAGNSLPLWVSSLGPILPDMVFNWQANQAWTKTGGLTTPAALGVTTTRATARTNLLPISPPGFAYTTFPANTMVQDALGRHTYTGRKNNLLNSTSPVTQTTASLATGTYVLWVNETSAGSGSATTSAGTATITGAGTATTGSPNTITVTVAGTVTVTVAGSLRAFQLELVPTTATGPSPLLVTGGATLSGSADQTILTGLTVGGSAITMFSAFLPQLPVSPAIGEVLLFASDNNGANGSSITRNSLNSFAVGQIRAGGATQNNTGVAIAQYLPATIAFSYSGTSSQMSLNNATITTATLTNLPTTGTQINFGARPSNDSYSDSIIALDAIWLNQAVPNTQLQTMNAYQQFFMGDSLTLGFGSSAFDKSNGLNNTCYPALVAAANKKWYYNGGVASATSTQILANVQALPANYLSSPNAFWGFWAGRNDFNSPTTVLSNIAAMVAAVTSKHNVVISITNADFSTEYQGQTQYNTIVALNASLASAYGSKYVEVRNALIAAYNPANGVDVFNHTNDVIPFTLRSIDISGTIVGALGTSDTTFTTSIAVTHGYTLLVDNEYIYINSATGTSVTSATRGYGSSTPATHSAGVAFAGTDPLHLNDAGYAIVAGLVEAVITANGW